MTDQSSSELPVTIYTPESSLASPAKMIRDMLRDLLASRELAWRLALRALIDHGWVKVQNFRRSDNKRAYAYLLTPQGIEAKARITARFLQRKRAEYEILKAEIEQLPAEVRVEQERSLP